jgi:eukaryotic-like serine/threonine-protein kinase
MAAADPIPPDENYLSSLIEYHESLSGSSVEAEPPQSIEAEPRPSGAEQDPELSARLKRAHGFLRRLHAWGEEKSEIRSGQPRGDMSDSATESSCGPGEDPTRVGRFLVVRELGRGAFGIVFLAIDPLLGREVALKLPAPQVVVTAGLCRRFLREAQAAAGLSHPNLVNVYETGTWGPAAYIATEYCPGETLAAWLQDRAEPVPAAAAATLVATLARALDYAHNEGVIHRDLKPSNIVLMTQAGASSAPTRAVVLDELVPKITDFGLAKLLENDPAETRSATILGTPIYMAPEQAESRLGDIGPQTDVYALGVILYEILTGRLPFSGTTDVETLKRVTQDDPQLLRRLRPEVPRDLEAVCLKCLEKSPAGRYQTAAALSDDLEQFLAGRSTKARPLGRLGSSLRVARRHVAVTALLATLGVFGVAALAGHWWQTAQMRRVLALNATIRDQAQGQQRAAQKQLAFVQASLVRQYNYARDVSSASAAWKMGHLADAVKLLARHFPKSGAVDSREFVWHYLWRQCHAERLTIRGEGTRIYAVAYLSDGACLATAGGEGKVCLRDVASGRLLATLRGHVGDVNAVSFSPDGRLLVTAGDDCTVRLWNVAPPAPRAIMRGHQAYVQSVAFSPDGTTVASASDEDAVRLWETAAARQRLALHVHNGHVRGLAFSPDGALLVTGARDGTCQVWDLKTERTRREWTAHPGGMVNCISFSHDGRILVTAGRDGKIRIWDPATSALKSTLSGHLDEVVSVSVAPDDRTLAAAVGDGTVWRWDLAGAKPLATIAAHAKRAWDIKFSPDGWTLATASRDGTVKLWDADAGQTHATIAGLTAPPDVLAFWPDGSQVAGVIPGSVGDGGKLRAWDVHTGAKRGNYLDLDGRLGGATSSIGAALAVRGTIDGNGLGIHLMVPNRMPADAPSWQSNAFILKPAPDQRPVTITCVALSGHLRYLATGHPHGKVMVWALRSGLTRATMSPENAHDVCAVQFSPDGSLVAAASQSGTVRLWKAALGTLCATLEGHRGAVRSLAFSPKGSELATAGADGTVRVWSTASGSEQVTLQGHSGEVQSLAFSPDGKTLASGGEGGTFKLWHTATWQELMSIDAHRGDVRFLAFSPDGMLLASSGATSDGRGEIFFWRAAASEVSATQPRSLHASGPSHDERRPTPLPTALPGLDRPHR